MRDKEFGSTCRRAYRPGQREVPVTLELFGAGRSWRPRRCTRQRVNNRRLGVMFQMGQVGGQLVGMYLKSMIPDVPEFDDSGNAAEMEIREYASAGNAGRRNRRGVWIAEQNERLAEPPMWRPTRCRALTFAIARMSSDDGWN